MILINGRAENRIEITDRGLQYGDGLFETLPYRNGYLEYLDAHLKRLTLGCERLSIPFQHLDLLITELETFCHTLIDDFVIKIIITRGSGGRGYFANNIEPTRIISSHPFPTYPDTYSQLGVSVRLCKHKLSENPILAGIKHLNRLDQVIARNEWDDTTIAEGLMFDQQNNLIEATMSNIFIVKSGQLLTPLLTTSGIVGVMRAEIIRLAIEHDIPVKEVVLTQKDLLNADEVFVCNSVNGLWPVNFITDTQHTYPVGSVTKLCQDLIMQAQK